MRDAQAHLLRLVIFAAHKVDLPNVPTDGFDGFHGTAVNILGGERLLAVEEEIAFASTGIGQFNPYAGRGAVDVLEFGGTTEDVEVGTDDYRLTGATIEIVKNEVLVTAAG